MKDLHKDFSGKKVSSNELVVVDFLNGVNTIDETDLYVIINNCLYAKSKGAKIFLLYKEDNKIFYRFAENNKNFTKKILPLIYGDLELYLMHREIERPKIRKDIFELVDVGDMLTSMIYIYIEYKYHKIITDCGHDFLEILFKQVREFDAEDELFSDYTTKKIARYTKSKDNPDYGFAWGMDNIPQIDIPAEYIELKPENLKRAYKINCLIS